MYNADKPSLEELPSSAQLLKSTFLAALAAVVILVTVILPAEYGIDPTGTGRVLDLTEMGEIKEQLNKEAERDRLKHGGGDESTSLFDGFPGMFFSPAYAQSPAPWTDEATFTLEPGETHELKLTMKESDVAEYKMAVEGGRVNFDLHAHGNGQSTTYEKGRGSTGSEGELVAKFDGDHGWFWRNRDKSALTVKLQVRGTYSAFKQGG
ncbi:MAG: transmembrane anchor protein [Pseudomonadota bacterium]